MSQVKKIMAVPLHARAAQWRRTGLTGDNGSKVIGRVCVQSDFQIPRAAINPWHVVHRRGSARCRSSCVGLLPDVGLPSVGCTRCHLCAAVVPPSCATRGRTRAVSASALWPACLWVSTCMLHGAVCLWVGGSRSEHIWCTHSRLRPPRAQDRTPESLSRAF